MADAPGMLIGIDIGGTKTAVVLGRASAGGLAVVSRRAFPTEPGTRPWSETLAAVAREAREMLQREAPGAAVAAAGISCGGPLDSRAGVLLSPPNLPGWDRVPVVQELERALGCRAFLQNDANACALAEWRYGAGEGTRNMLFLTFGTGMGAGLILDGRLYEGTSDLGGEVGHIRLAEDGPDDSVMIPNGVLARLYGGREQAKRRDGVWRDGQRCGFGDGAEGRGERDHRFGGYLAGAD